MWTHRPVRGAGNKTLPQQGRQEAKPRKLKGAVGAMTR